jgi:flagellin
MLSIQTNVNSMNAQENLRMTNDFQARTIARLTSGYRINQSGDDAAGLAVANKFRSDIAELTQGVRNANDGLSTMQIIDGGLSNISQMLDRLKTLSTQSASSGFEGDRATLDREFQALLTEIDRQAANIGLGSGGGSASRYNKDLKIYTGGGGDYTSNSSVQIDLSATTDVVTSAQLGLSGLNIMGGDGTNLGTFSTANVTANTTFTFSIEGQASAVTATITGQASGYTANEALQDLNDQIGEYGLRASVVDGEVRIFSDKAFKVAAGGAYGAGQMITAGTTTVVNADQNHFHIDSGNLAGMGNGAANTDSFTVTFDDGTTKTITSATNASWATVGAAVTDLNAQLQNTDVYVMTDEAGTGLQFFSRTKARRAVRRPLPVRATATSRLRSATTPSARRPPWAR